VFYAIGIIITAYLPIFTLQAVEGRLFKPMAWTVAFALLGALLFSMIIAPVLSSIFFRKGVKEWHNPILIFITNRYRGAVTRAIVLRRAAGRRGVDQRGNRLRIPAASRRRRHLGSRHTRSQYRTY
jgi:Cu/Ag efflux pump CusA